MQRKLLQNVPAVRLHRGQADVQQMGHVLVRFAFREQLQDFALAAGQQFITILQSPRFSCLT